MKTRDIKTRRPWRIIRPEGYFSHGTPFIAENEPAMPSDSLRSDIMTQADMLRQFYPSGHIINDPTAYPDIYREQREPVYDADGNDTGKTVRRVYKECVPRYTFAFQQIIALKQLIHLTGNDIQFELNTSKPTKEQLNDYNVFREGWVGKGMEVAFCECVKSEKITADAAFVGFVENREFGWRTFSYKTGSTLYPHYDNRGKLKLFARSFYDYDEEGEIVVEWLEVWDNTYYYLYKQNGEKYKTAKDRILGIFGMEGYTRVDKKAHGFPFIPVAYRRNDDGPCWLTSQDSIDSYELSFSQMAHNNQAYGEPILVFMGEGENYDVQHDLNGTVRSISMSKEDKVDFLQSQSASESYMKQLDTLYRMIYEQSFAVIPPELRSGDLPGVAIKLLYSPALEKAMGDAVDWQPFLDDMVRIFAFGYGLGLEKTIDFATLPLRSWIKPYVHINESAVMSDLAAGVNSGFISRQTASERAPEYTSVGEWERIVREQKEAQQADLLFQLKTEQNNSNNQNQSQKKTDGENNG